MDRFCDYEKCDGSEDEWVHDDVGSYHEFCRDLMYTEDAAYWLKDYDAGRFTRDVETPEAYGPGSAKWFDTRGGFDV